MDRSFLSEIDGHFWVVDPERSVGGLIPKAGMDRERAAKSQLVIQFTEPRYQDLLAFIQCDKEGLVGRIMSRFRPNGSLNRLPVPAAE